MKRGIFFALLACFIWGSIFIIPQYMQGFTSIEIALSRYLFYGLISLLLYFLQRITSYPRAIWYKALYLSATSTIVYYLFVVLSLRFATPAICALILGISPITISFYGNWKRREISFTKLLFPSLLILIGLAVINMPPLLKSHSPSTFLLGVLCSFSALASWTWFAVENSLFLKKHPEIPSSDWSTLMGVATLLVVITATLLCLLFFPSQISFHKYTTLNSDLIHFLIGSALLGIFCSWIGAYLWNRACTVLPVSLAGQLTLFETIFGVLFIYALNREFPPPLECIGIALLLGAILFGIRQYSLGEVAEKQD